MSFSFWNHPLTYFYHPLLIIPWREREAERERWSERHFQVSSGKKEKRKKRLCNCQRKERMEKKTTLQWLLEKLDLIIFPIICRCWPLLFTRNCCIRFPLAGSDLYSVSHLVSVHTGAPGQIDEYEHYSVHVQDFFGVCSLVPWQWILEIGF